MQAFLEKINKNRKILFFVFFISFFPAVGFAVEALDKIVEFFDPDNWLVGTGNFILMVVGYVLKMSAMVFDNMLAITMSTELFNTGFVKVAWSNIRDIANIAFILGAIMIAFSMMFDHGDWEKSLVKLIVIIFALNFSLFFARIIVDAGNITASVFLTSMSVKLNDPNHFIAAKSFYKNGENMEFASVATPFVAALKIEALVGTDNFENFQKEVVAKEFGGTYLFLAIVVAFVTFALAKHLFVGSFMFLSRMVWIIYYMVSAPVFFVSYFIPNQGNVLKTKWLFPLLGKTFGVVVYLFFIWLALMILSSGNVNDIDASSFLSSPKSKEDDISNGIAIVLTIFVIKGVFIILVLKQANKIGTDMLENGKGILSEYAGKAWGAGAGVVKSLPSIATRFTPIGMVGRSAMGIAGRSVGKMAMGGMSSKNGMTRFMSERASLFGKGMMETKIGGKSYRDDQNARNEILKTIEDDMSKEDKEKRRKAQYGITNEHGHIDLKKYAEKDDKGRVKWTNNAKAIKYENMRAEKDEETNSEVDKKILEYLAQSAKKEGLDTKEEISEFVEKEKAKYKEGNSKYQTELEKEEKTVRGKKMMEFMGGVSTSDVKFKTEGEDSIVSNSKKGLLGRLLMPGIEANRNRILEDEESKNVKIKDNERKKKQQIEIDKISNEAKNKKLKITEDGNGYIKLTEDVFNKFTTNKGDYDHIDKALTVVITNPDDRESLKNEMMSIAERRQNAEKNKPSKDDIDQINTEISKKKKEISEKDLELKNWEAEMATASDEHKETITAEIIRLNKEKESLMGGMDNLNSFLKTAENNYNEQMEVYKTEIAKTDEEKNKLLKSVVQRVKDYNKIAYDEITANANFERSIIKEKMADDTKRSGDAIAAQGHNSDVFGRVFADHQSLGSATENQ